MMRTATWFIRVAGLALVGVLTFVSPPTEAGGAATQTVVYVLMCLGAVGWAVADRWAATSRPSGSAARLLLPGSLGLIVVAGCLGAAAGGAGDILIGFAIGAQMSVGSELSLALAVGLTACGVLAVEVGGIVFAQGAGTLLGFPLLLMVGLLVGRNRASFRVQAEQSAALLAQHERLRAEQRRADVLDERARIAREIHDVLAHSLGALSIQIQTARALFTDLDDPERGLRALDAAQRMAADGLTETRRAVLALRNDTLPLHEELARACTEHADVHRVGVHCAIGGAPRPVPPDCTVALLRTARESLVNAAKHAPGQTIDVHLDYAPGSVRMTIANNLADHAGTDAKNADMKNPDVQLSETSPVLHTVDGGYGLTGMHERLRLLRGTLDAGVRGGEWIVTAELPLAPHPTPEKADR